jgi:predicted small lipoprotein YifL
MYSVAKKLTLLTMLFGLISGCGDSGPAYFWFPQSSQRAVLFKTEVQIGSTALIGSINVTADLPDGVTVTADSAGAIPRSALFLSGQGAVFAAQPNTTAILIGKFTPATATAKAKVSLAYSGIVNSGGAAPGMKPGEFATLMCTVAPGTSFPTTTILPISGVDIADSLGTLPHLSDTLPPAAWITYQILP